MPTPIDRSAHRALPRQRRSFAAVEDPETFVEAAREFGRFQHRHARGRKLERERDTVETASDLAHRRNVRAVEREAGFDRAGTLFEESDRTIRASFVDARELECRRDIERRNAVDAFAPHGERFATGGEYGNGRTVGEERRDTPRDFVDEVFAIIEHQQRALRAECEDDGGDVQTLRRLRDAEGRCDRRRYESGISERCQVDECDAVRVFRDRAPCELEREPRFTDAARADERGATRRRK